MTEVDDFEIIRRFLKPNMLNLLTLQAELAGIEVNYEATCYIYDSSSDTQEEGFTQSLYALREFEQLSPGSQLQLLDRINDTLHKYNEEIWGKLSGSDAKTSTSDQVTLIQRESGFSRGVVVTLVFLYDLIWRRYRNRTKRVDIERNQTYYSEFNVRSAAKVLTSVLASLFPGIVILALYLIDTTLKRIGAMLCFTTFFAFVAVEVVFIGSASTK
ncbi:uncharacterized protein EAE98_007653 [Botrytis deweyae]|uniref:DUF6594 domain-containing protein n=1 Tax=Botrytis deweyae TaxID=2478750 RepID=A0ABQ7IGW0_9HELO|nr:uncharacterized protein EAE98_007653 [Botrytis deweyae]KAF7923835.1 hypothetical protein EAE98_007653 [Botrytis deweyae]